MWNRVSVFLVGVVASINWPLIATAQEATKPEAPQAPPWSSGHGHWHMWGDHAGWHFWWTPLMMILFFILIIIVARSTRFGRWGHMMHGWHGGPSRSAIEILNERFAKGEIDEDEYKDKKAKIRAA